MGERADTDFSFRIEDLLLVVIRYRVVLIFFGLLVATQFYICRASHGVGRGLG